MMMNDDWLINYLGPAIHFVTLTLTLRVPSWTYTAPEKATQWCMKLLENY